MKSRILKTSIGSIIFLLLVIAAIALIHPVYVKVNSILTSEAYRIARQLEKSTGIKFEYGSLSPSVLAGINIREIRLKDSASGEDLLFINKVSVSYRFRDFFSGNPAKAIRLVLLDGVTLEYDAVKDNSIAENLKALFSNQQGGSRKEKNAEENKRTFSLAGREIQIPFAIQLKNIRLHYTGENFDLLVSFKNADLTKSPKVNDGVVLKISGKADFRTELVRTERGRRFFSCGFEISGTLFDALDGSSFLVELSETGNADFSLRKTELLLNYSDSVLSLRTARSSLPYSFLAVADFESYILTLDASADSFEPLSLVRMRDVPKIFSKLEGTSISGTAGARASFASGQDFLDSLEFSLNGNCVLSKKILGSPEIISFALSFSEDVLSVANLSASGERISANLSGEYNVKTRQPSGVLSLDRFVLGNGGIMQTEVYIDAYRNGFMFFAPQLFLGDRSLTAIQLTLIPASKSLDFSFEFDDYSHDDYGQNAHVSMDGSYMSDSGRVVQASVSVADMFLDSIVENAAFFMPDKNSGEKARAFSRYLEKYIFSDELYFTTDFKTFSFNSPYFILANTEREKELLAFSLDGSSQTVTLSGLDLQYGNQTAHLTVGADFSRGMSDFNFYADLVLNSIPYGFHGSVSQNFLSISGDYGFALVSSFEKKVSGSLEFTSLPVSVGNIILSTSASTSFSWSDGSGPEISIESFDLEESYGTMRLRPHLAFSGSANRYGFAMEKLAYSDISSALDGNMNIAWSLNDGIFDSINVDLNAKSILSSEAISILCELRNPEKKVLNLDSLKNDFYVSAQCSVQSFPVSRFLTDQNTEDTISADLSVSGTLTNPFLSLSLQNASVNLAGYTAAVSALAVLDDNGLSVSDLNASWGLFKLSDVSAFFDPRSYSGSLSALLSGSFLDLDFSIPLKSTFYSLSPGKNPSEDFIMNVLSDKMTGSFFPTEGKLDLLVTRSMGHLGVVSDGGKGFSLSIDDGGFVSAKSGSSSPLGFSVNGEVSDNRIELDITGLSADMGKLCQTVSIPFVKFTDGHFAGAVKISGLTTDPEITGAVTVSDPEFSIPFVSKEIFRADKVLGTAGQGHFTVKPTDFSLDKNPVKIGLDIELDRWTISLLDCQIQTDRGRYVPLDLSLPFVHFNGYGGFDDFRIRLTSDYVAFTGAILGERSDITINTRGNRDESVNESSGNSFLVDLELRAKNRVQILFNPILRGVIVPDNSMHLYMDTRTGEFSARGEVNLRGGEIVWLNRNFYMKEGKVVFNESNGLFDPRVTVRAETRERDENNNQVTITLSAMSQPLSQLSPRFFSTPAKSENEIMELLGQVVAGNSDNAASLAVAGGDYIMQATVMRSVENTLRELLNFDIFSIRTNILQNAVKRSLDRDSSDKQITFGNFFDNSAVYIGKYFGSEMYVDALMRWNYDETKAGDDDSVQGLVFQPEFGIEMNSPFVNIRLGVAPDLEAIRNNFWTPATSITLSWKHSF